MANILCVDTVADIDGNINDSKHDIIIICNQQLHELENGQNHLDSIPEWKIVNGIKYEFRLLIKIENIGNSVNWNGEVYSRHGGKILNGGIFPEKISIAPNIKRSTILTPMTETASLFFL